MFDRTILGNVDACRTECEISDSTANTIAVVYESHDGWHVNVLRTVRTEELTDFNATVEAAKQSLSQYVNRIGSNPPNEITSGGLSLWLMQKNDGTALGIDLTKPSNATAFPLPDVPPDVMERVRSIAQSGHPLEAIRELRKATNCSLEQAKKWLNDNC